MKHASNAAPLFLVSLVLAALSAKAVAAGDDAASKALSADDRLERGRYLVTTSGCHDCHTPFVPGPKGPEPDMTRMLSGHPETLVMPPPPSLGEGPWATVIAATNTAYSGFWGVSFTANLTPDRETGLGKWTLRNFVDTIRTGRHLGRGRPVLPPMPIPVYSNFTDADLEAIFTFLQSIQAIRNRVPEPLPPVTQATSE